MKIQYLNGGLANQVFQYIFARFAYFYSNGRDTLFLDDSYFYTESKHNGYELDKVFGLKPELLSVHLAGESWEYMIDNRKRDIGVCQSVKDLGIDIKMVSEVDISSGVNSFNGKIYTIPSNEFYPEILNMPGDVYYHGYWINKEWYGCYKKQFIKELVFPKIVDAGNKKYEKIILERKTIGVHVRRGDFVSLGWELPEDYYGKSLASIRKLHSDAVIMIFSDDIEWCRQNREVLGFYGFSDVLYVEGNVDGKNYIDLYLMQCCEGLVMSNSSFCYLAALLNTRLRYVCNPTKRKI
ncbi:alpha-1,2-fucosyltransferase [Lachnospiraceae bacterium OttesenSCG-928-D06]|nr:alpha-1,2-fucosyltransferase [Lachnospiraceae bacterium OttesenSCG-928-D06]